jgi:hypothetical protein
MQKILGKPGFTTGEDRNRTFGSFVNVFGEFERYRTVTLLVKDRRAKITSVQGMVYTKGFIGSG